MTKKQVLRTFAFLLLLFMVLVILCDLFEYQNSNMSRRYQKYKELADNTVDAVYIGTSGVDRYWISSKAYEEYGMTVYPLSTEGLPAWLVKNLLKEALKYQDPQLVIFDVRPFIFGNYGDHVDITDVRIRRVIDMLPFLSFNRIDAIHRSETVMREVDPEFSVFDSMYYFSFVRYHNKWSDDSFSFDELDVERAGYMGFYVAKSLSTKRAAVAESAYNDEYVDLDPVSSRYLYELFDYIREQDLNVLFVDSIVQVTEEERGIRNTLWKILDEEGFDYVSYNEPEYDALFSREKETSVFYNSSHVNYYGAEIYTELFSAYLNEHYSLPDRRSEEAVQKDWDGIYAKTVKRIKTIEKK